MQPLLKSSFLSLSRIVCAVLFAWGIASSACTQYRVAPDDGGDAQVASGGAAGSATTGKGGGSGGTTNTGAGGAGGTMSPGMGGSGGSTTGVDAAVQDAPVDMPADKPALDAPIDTGSSLLANGASCSSGSQCQSKNCVDSYCCDSACSGQCQSCGESTSTGKCVTVSGAVRGQIRPTCTGTGLCGATCNGTDPNQCHFPGSEKQCADPTCTAGVAHAAAKCDGAGTCPAGGMTNCDPFACGGTACKTTCATSTDCSSAGYCAGPTCVAKKGLGAVCGAGEQCTTAICGGRCCSAPCTCPQPTGGNLFKNAGFDSDITGLDFFTGGSSSDIRWTSQDADGCPFSGSVQVIVPGMGNPSQCVPVTAGAGYTFGGWFRNLDGNGYGCTVTTLTGANCTGSPTGGANISGFETAWTFHSALVLVPANSVSAMLECESNMNSFFDKLFLSTTGSF